VSLCWLSWCVIIDVIKCKWSTKDLINILNFNHLIFFFRKEAIEFCKSIISMNCQHLIYFTSFIFFLLLHHLHKRLKKNPDLQSNPKYETKKKNQIFLIVLSSLPTLFILFSCTCVVPFSSFNLLFYIFTQKKRVNYAYDSEVWFWVWEVAGGGRRGLVEAVKVVVVVGFVWLWRRACP
jgi:hypothetical protein